MKYLGLDNYGWHLVNDEEKCYALTRTKGVLDPLKAKDGYSIMLCISSKNNYWLHVKNMALRKQIILTAWPMCAE